MLGANGRTGRELVREGIQRGHDVMAADLGFEGFPFDDAERLRFDVTEAGKWPEQTLEADKVVSGLGVTGNTSSDVVSRGVEAAVQNMEEHGIERLVVLTGAGAKLPSERKTLSDRFLNLAATLAMPGAVEDGRKMVREIQDCRLDWTVVRAPRLTTGERTHSYTTGDLRVRLWDSVSRADIAEFMLECVENDLYVKEMPFIR